MYSFVYLFALPVTAVAALMGHSSAGRSSSDTVAAIKQELMLAPRANNVIFSKSSEIDSSIEDFPLFKMYASIPHVEWLHRIVFPARSFNISHQ